MFSAFGGDFEAPRVQNTETRFLIIDLPSASHEFWFDHTAHPRLMHTVRTSSSDVISSTFVTDDTEDDALAAAIVLSSVQKGYEPGLAESRLRRCLRRCMWLRGTCLPLDARRVKKWMDVSSFSSPRQSTRCEHPRPIKMPLKSSRACRIIIAASALAVRPLTEEYYLYQWDKDEALSSDMQFDPDKPPRGLHKERR